MRTYHRAMPLAPAVSIAAVDQGFVASLPGCDFADAFSVVVPHTGLDARPLAASAFDNPPDWAAALMRLRNAIMGRLGYKAPDMRRSGFPVLSSSAEEVVMGLDDGHLDFRALVRVSAVTGSSSRITLTTAVATHNWRGRLYLAAIMPFHKLIVRNMLQRMAQQLA